ncbi:unnamed protein product [Natator depressus]
MQPVSPSATSQDKLYTHTLTPIHFLALMSCPDIKWLDILSPIEEKEPWWASLYSTLIPRPTRNISWLGSFMERGHVVDTIFGLPWHLFILWERETLAYPYLECDRWQPLFRTLWNPLCREKCSKNLNIFIYSLPIHGPTKSRDLLVGLLFTLVKKAIYLSRRRTLDGVYFVMCGQ